jgi:hypothetical protein
VPLSADLGQVALHLGLPGLPAQALMRNFHPVALPVLVVPQPLEGAQDRLGRVEDLALEEVEEDPADTHDGTAARGHLEAAPPSSVLADQGPPADVVDGGIDVSFRAALEADLELQAGVAEAVAQEEPREASA